MRCKACSSALTTCLFSWPGLVTLGSPERTGISSLVNSLQMSPIDTQAVILGLLFNVFLLRTPKWTADFDEALQSCGESIVTASNCTSRVIPAVWDRRLKYVSLCGLDTLKYLSMLR